MSVLGWMALALTLAAFVAAKASGHRAGGLMSLAWFAGAAGALWVAGWWYEPQAPAVAPTSEQVQNQQAAPGPDLVPAQVPPAGGEG